MELRLMETSQGDIQENDNMDYLGPTENKILWSNRKYKVHHISKLKWYSSRLAVVLAQSIEATC